MRFTSPRGLALAAPLLALCAATTAGAQNLASQGFVLESEADVPFGQTWSTLSDGSTIRWDGASITRYDVDHNLVQTYATFFNPVFPSFVRVDPTETYALVGESSNGSIGRLHLASGSYTALATLAFNYDLAWDVDPQFAWISAATGGFGAGNYLVRLDIQSGATEMIVHVAGPSGPVSVDEAGNLYYVTQFDGWPIPLGQADLLRWDDAELDAGLPLDEFDADLLLDGLDGSASMVHDAESGSLVLVNTNFSGSAFPILRVDLAGNVVDELATAPETLGNLEVFSSPGPQVLAGYQPSGSILRYSWTDFGLSLTRMADLGPLRPELEFVGPTSNVPGPATLTLTGAPANGFAVFTLARPSSLLPMELAADLGWGVPTFLATTQNDVLRRSQPLLLDGNGSTSLNYNQPGNAFGGILFQALVYDATGAPVGTSEWLVND